MTREELGQLALDKSISNKTIVLQLATGTGKTRISIDIVNNRRRSLFPKVLILVAQSVHKINWRDELTKWNAEFTPIIECYNSIHKYVGQEFDFVLLDEAQHLSERRREIFNTIKVKTNLIVLSATLPKEVKNYLKWARHAHFISVNTNEAIESNILPDPKIIKIPLKFDNNVDEAIIINKGKPNKRGARYSKNMYFACKRDKYTEWTLYCTKQEYYNNISTLIDWYKNKHRDVQMLRASSERLKWLAYKKNNVVKHILKLLESERTVTFCTNIAQSEELGKNCIHSKNKSSQYILDAFNKQEINHITACHILDEGMNLVNCRVGVFANLNASDIMFIQRIGRILRHKEPIVIIPYFVGTRDEELVNKHLEGYSTDLIKTIYNIKDIKL